MNDVARIAEKIAFCVGVAQQALLAQELTEEELDAYSAYVNRQDTTMPILDPTAYRRVLREGTLDKVKARIRALRALIMLDVPEETRAVVEQEPILKAARAKQLMVLWLAGEQQNEPGWMNDTLLTLAELHDESEGDHDA